MQIKVSIGMWKGGWGMKTFALKCLQAGGDKVFEFFIASTSFIVSDGKDSYLIFLTQVLVTTLSSLHYPRI